MKSLKKMKTIILSVLFGTALLFSATAKESIYNVTVGVGSNISEVRFNWISNSSTAPVVQIAKANKVKKDKFPSNSSYSGVVLPVSATEGVLNNPDNVETSTGEYADKVTVENLSADTTYSYRVGDGTSWSSIYTFETGDKNSVSFAAFGDPQMGASGDLDHDRKGWTKTLETVMKNHKDVNFLFSLGDQVNDYGSLATQQDQYKAFFNPVTSKDYIQDHELAVLEGNHDHQMGRYYSYHYNLPNETALGQTSNNNSLNNDGDYWFTYGPVLFMVLEGNNFYDTAAHSEFIKESIASNKNSKWTIVTFHQAPYSEANHSQANKPDDDTVFMRQNWTKIMDQYHIDVVMNGHDHYYTRTFQMFGGMPVNTTKTNKVTNPKGTVYITLDSGTGSKYYKYNTSADHSFSAVGWQNNEPTFSYVKVTNKKFTITTYNTDDGSVIDTYTINKK